ncbi:hypothetical protein [Nocardioides zeae]|uniref:Uncharacterized protein n=1 Tax=Nocardioides zeae TaxID=1457234 RepID=A0A6P0HGN5_9ACTN|nr:hypothetical protein [Nocardioides zeae]NEN77803.1 hypothetical protein [Nocardioides zeae]
MTLFPALATARVELEPTSFRSALDLQEELGLAPADAAGMPDLDLVTELACPAEPGRIALQYDVRPGGADGGDPVGVATLWDLDPHAGHVRAGLQLAPGVADAVAHETRLLLLNVAFATWRVAKVYVHEVHGAWAWDAPGARLEGTLRDYLHDGSRTLDMDVVAVYRSDWDREGREVLGALLGD